MKNTPLGLALGLALLITSQISASTTNVDLTRVGLKATIKAPISLKALQELSGLIRVFGKRFHVEIDLKDCESKFTERKKELKEFVNPKFFRNDSTVMFWEETSVIDDSKSYDFMMIIKVKNIKVLCSSNASAIMDGTPTRFTKKEIEVMMESCKSMAQ